MDHLLAPRLAIRDEYLFAWKKPGQSYRTVKLAVNGDDHWEMEVSISPTGRSKQVFINGKKVWP